MALLKKNKAHKRFIGLFSILSLAFILAILSINLISAIWTSNLNTNLTAYYSFDEGSGNTIVSNISALNNGTSSNTAIVGGILGKARYFDGINAHINVTSNNGVFDFINTTSRASLYTINYWLGVNDTTNLFFQIVRNQSTYTPFTIGNTFFSSNTGTSWTINSLGLGSYTLNTWKMITIKSNETGVYTYSDGVFVDSKPPINITSASIGNLGIGRGQQTSFFHGTIDELGFWYRDLSDAEITQLYNSGNGITYLPSTIYAVLNSPADSSLVITGNPINFSCTSYGISNLKNISFLTNETGSWLVNQTVDVSSLNQQTIQQGFIHIPPNSLSWTCYACDNTDNCGYGLTNNTLIVSNYIINSQSYNNNTIEGAVENFAINISIPMGFVYSSSYLNYDGTSYLASTINNGGNSYSLSKTINIPFVNANVNKTFYWILNFGGNSYNTTSKNQTVLNIDIDNCTTYTNLLYNFTVYDQDSLLYITSPNATFDLNLNIAPYGTTNYFLNFSKSYGNATDKKVCINIPLNQSVYSISMVAGYQQYGYTKQFYYLDNVTLTNATNPNINLYDLLLGQTTTFLLTYSDSSGGSVPNAIVHLYRYYIGEGLYREVENGLLDSASSTHLHLVEEDVIYYFTVTLHNQLLYTSPSYQAICVSSPCTIGLSQSTTFPTFPVNWGVYNGTSIATAVNKSSRQVLLYFVSNDVHTLNMTLYTINNGANVYINTTSLTATAGTLSLTVPYPYGNQTFFIDIYQDGQYLFPFVVDLGTSAKDLFGAFGVFLVILMVACLILIAGTDGVMTIVFAVLGLMVAIVLYLIDMGWVVIISIILAGGLIIWKISSRKR